MTNQKGVVMMIDAKLDDINCCAQAIETTPPIKRTMPKTIFFFMSAQAGKGSSFIKQYIKMAQLAIKKRKVDIKKGGKLFKAIKTP